MSDESLFGANKSPEVRKSEELKVSSPERAPTTAADQAEKNKTLESRRAELKKLEEEEKKIDSAKELLKGAALSLAKGEPVDGFDLQRKLGTTAGTGELAATGNVMKFVEDQLRYQEGAESKVRGRKLVVEDDIRDLERS